MSDEKPMYRHDCNNCTYLGRHAGDSVFAGGAHDFDLYYCPQGMAPTIIARFGSSGPEYISGLVVAKFDPVLREGLKRAQAATLIGKVNGR